MGARGERLGTPLVVEESRQFSGRHAGCAGVERPGGGGTLKGPTRGPGEARVSKGVEGTARVPAEVVGTGGRGPDPIGATVGAHTAIRLKGAAVSSHHQPAPLWLTLALASVREVAAGPGVEGRKREGRRTLRTPQGIARPLDPKVVRPAAPQGPRVRTPGIEKGGAATSLQVAAGSWDWLWRSRSEQHSGVQSV